MVEPGHGPPGPLLLTTFSVPRLANASARPGAASTAAVRSVRAALQSPRAAFTVPGALRDKACVGCNSIDGFTLFRAGYSLDWENWVLPNGLPQAPGTQALLGISVVTEDRELGQALVDLLGGAMAHYTLGESYTFVVERY